MKMKIYYLLLINFVSIFAFAQNRQAIPQAQIDLLKKEGRLPANYSVTNPAVHTTIISPRISPSHNMPQSGTVCNCIIPIDSTFQVVPFDGSGGSGGPGAPPDYRNDDWSTVAIALPFSFCYFGTPINTIYINNNGNISITTPYSTFTSDSFPTTNFEMIAPFWGDVDTRNPASGLVYYKVTPTSLIVIWDHVGYYNSYSNLLNTFQLIITNGLDSLVPNGNTAFCYGDMQWTTGDASGGTSGFGGTPSTVGANLGDTVNFIQFGRFNTAGYGYTGPYSTEDSLDWLDNSNFIFDLCPSNVPPIPFDCLNDTVFLHVGNTTTFDLAFASPELSQITSINVVPGGLANFSVLNNTSGNVARFSGQIIGDATNIGDNSIAITATDNGTPPQTRSYNKVFHIDAATGISEQSNQQFSISPNPYNDEAMFNLNSTASGNITFTLTDITGREILRRENISSNFRIRKADTGNGVFIYHVFDKGKLNITGKVIVY